MSEFTCRDVVAKVREIAAADPDFVYTPPTGTSRCVYVETNPDGSLCPSCIIGRALVALGVDLAELHASDRAGTTTLAGVMVVRFATDSDPVALRWLRHVQSSQDDGDRWSVAVRLADEAVPELAA